MSDNNETFSLHIKQSDGKKHTVTASADQTVLQLKEEVSKVGDVPVDRQRLIFAGKVLKDEDTLTSYNLKNDLTIHLVRSNPAAKAAAASATTTTPTPAAAQNTVTPATTGANPMANPFAAMGGGADSGMFGGGGMGQMPSNLQSTLMNDPNYMNMVTSLMSNPEVVREMVQNNPQLQSMGMSPEQISSMVSMMNSPHMREMMANPQMREMMASMGGGAGGANPFAAMGGAGGNPFGAGATPEGGAPANMPNLAALMSQFGGANPMGGATGAAAQPAANLPPPEERFQVQLQQLNDMGFYDAQKNIRALLATGGNVHAAIEYLFSNTD